MTGTAADIEDMEPLRMLNVYLFNPDKLNPRAREALPGYVRDIRGNVNAYSPAQALNKLIGGLDLPESIQPYRILDELLTCALDEGSGFYSPGFMKVMGEIYPIKRNMVAWLVRNRSKRELGSFRGPMEERRRNAVNFAEKYGLAELSQNPTKAELESGLRKTLTGMKKNELVAEYKSEIGQSLSEEPEPGRPEEKKPMQLLLFSP